MKKTLIVLASLLLAGCATTTKQIVVAKDTPNLRITEPAKPRAIKTQPVKIIVYDREKLEEALKDPNFRRILGLSDKDYKNMANNYEEAIRFIEAQDAIIEYYQTVINELRERKIITDESVQNTGS